MVTPSSMILVDVTDIFYFFLFRGRGRGRRRPRRWPGGRFFIKSIGRGGVSRRMRGMGKGARGDVRGEGGGG